MRQIEGINRNCGGCNACCIVFPVPEVGKLGCDLCHHAIPGVGCSIYDDRPLACRLFACLWRCGQGDESYRPDKLGVMLDAEDVELPDKTVLIMHLWEIQPGALEQPVIQEMIELNKAAGHMLITHQRISASHVLKITLYDQTQFTASELQQIKEKRIDGRV